MKINSLRAMQIFDSRGNPTIEVQLTTRQGVFHAGVPSGASTGVHEAHELRDGGEAFLGKGVLCAVHNVNNVIAPALIGKNVKNQFAVDRLLLKLDGTKNKEKLGANAILGVSMAIARAGATALGVPLWKHLCVLAQTQPRLPVPCMNIINGGKHADNKLDVQEFMIIPVGATSFYEAMRIGTEVYHTLKKIIHTKYGATGVGDEGGFAPDIQSTDEALDLITHAIHQAGYDGKVRIGLDAAASEYYEQRRYNYEGSKLTCAQLTQRYADMVNKYHILSFEDPFDQDDFVAYTAFKPVCQVVGDDLLVTNVSRIKKAHARQACNALLLKVNQIGTVSESIKAAQLAYSYGWKVMVSHRSGETEDTFIADLAVGLGCGQIKTGAPCRSERVAKYNQLLRIELDSGLKYAGRDGF